ncbi:MAG: 50S ribosomal protein L22 [Firmicutes bacterium]|jgi:large subunit ribosomal protein L22|nr:50S ribosomal protein L22 [Bacillota bacterium]HQD38921.1 50S ribosomal protein L22 [Bacillota bacterium]
MEAKAVARHIRIAPRKVRQVIDLIRGKDVGEAEAILQFVPNRAAKPVYKLLRSAVANAEQNHQMDTDSLYISAAYVDEGPILKRFRPRAHGRADRIDKRLSHITVVLKEREG